MTTTPTVFDTYGCGMGDAVVAMWIAEGAVKAGHDVAFRKGSHVDSMLECFGQRLVEAEGGFTFGGRSPSYTYELKLEGYREDRAKLWQVGMPFEVEPARPTAIIPSRFEQEGKQMVQGRSQEGRPVVLLFPYAAWSTRCWPISKWIRLAWSLEAKGYATMALHTRLDDNIKAFPFYAYGYDLRTVMAMMREAHCVIANDSGSAHLAGTLGTKTYALMGPTDPHCCFGYCPDIVPVTISADELPCVGCHFKGAKGFSAACDRGCEALHILPVSRVVERVAA